MPCLSTYKLACLAIVSALTLSACSDRPSTRDVQGALDELLEQARIYAEVGDDVESPEVKVERVTNCEVRERGFGYICDVEFSISDDEGLPHEVWEMELMESSGGWVIIN